MKIIRPAFVLGGHVFCLLYLSLAMANAQQPPPRAYLFVEVKDTAGKRVTDADVEVFDAHGAQTLSGKTNEDGIEKTNFECWYSKDYYSLKVSKAGYLTYEQVFFLYPYPHGGRTDFISRVEELSNSLEDIKDYQTSPVRVVLRKTPVTSEKRRDVELQDRRRQLLLAAKRGDPATLRKLLRAGIKADTVDAKGVPAVAWAALAGDGPTIKALLDAGAVVRNKNRLGHGTLLIYLSEGTLRESNTRRSGNDNTGSGRPSLERHEEIVRRLIEAGAGVNLPHSYRGTVLNRAITQTPYLTRPQSSLSIETIRLLIAAGANVNGVDRDGRAALMLAAEKCSIDMVKLLLASGAVASVNAKDKAGRTALMYAVSGYYKNSASQVVQALIAAGANVNAVNEDGQNSLMLAAKAGSLELVKLLLESGAAVSPKDKKGQTALMYSSQPEYYQQPFNADISRALIHAGASVNERDAQGLTALMHSSKVFAAGSADTSRVLIEAGAFVDEKDLRGWTALMYAAPRYYEGTASEVARVLTAAHANVHAVNEDGQTALMLAAHWYSEEVIKLLIEAGAGASINAKDKKGQTALMHVCQTTRPIDVGLLIKGGAAASINEKDARGWTALMYTVPRYYASQDAKALIAAGANVNDVNEDGQTALMLAAKTGSIEIIKMLLESGAGASVDAKDKEGRTALMYAKSRPADDSESEVVKARAIIKLLQESERRH